MLEFKLKEAGRNGVEAWPPSYAEFMGYCEAPVCSKMYTKNQTELEAVYDKDNKLVSMSEKPKVQMIESDHMKIRRLKAGHDTCKSLLSMFDDQAPESCPEPEIGLEPCTNCQTNFEAILMSCPRCGEKR